VAGDGLWRPLALADWITVRQRAACSAERAAPGGLRPAARRRPDRVGLVALLVGRNIVSWRALKARAATPRNA